eukprot:scaffold9.g3024.t1
MPATVPTRGVLKPSTNRVRTSTALQGNAMWENVIGIVNEQAGTNTRVEALINAPTVGGGRKASKARQQAAAEAVLATGGFDTSITNYQSLLSLAVQQGAVGSATRGACKVCGQLGHLTKQCRNQFSSFYEGAKDKGAGEGGSLAAAAAAAAAEAAAAPSDSDGLGGLSSDSSGSGSSDSEAERRRRRRKEKRKERERRRSGKSSGRDRERKHKKDREKEKKRKHKKERRSKDRKEKRRRRSLSGGGSDSD